MLICSLFLFSFPFLLFYISLFLSPFPYPDDYDQCWDHSGPLAFDQFFPYLRSLAPGGDLSNGLFFRHRPPALGGALEIFSINSNFGHPKEASNLADSFLHRAQVSWLRSALAGSRAPLKVVLLHHPPHASARHDHNAQWVNLPYRRWGAHAVISGHQHAYERVQLPEDLAVAPEDPAAAAAAAAVPVAQPWRGRGAGSPGSARQGADKAEPVSPEHPNPAPSPQSAVYILNGLGGHNWVYSVSDCDAHPGSMRRYNAHHGILVASLARAHNAEAGGLAEPVVASAPIGLAAGGSPGLLDASIAAAAAGAEPGAAASAAEAASAAAAAVEAAFMPPPGAKMELSLCFISLGPRDDAAAAAGEAEAASDRPRRGPGPRQGWGTGLGKGQTTPHHGRESGALVDHVSIFI